MDAFIGGQALKFVIAFVAVLALIGVGAFLWRWYGRRRLSTAGPRGRQPRLAVTDLADVDGRRRLILVRRDNVEHLVMIGGPTDIVVESNIGRAPAANAPREPRFGPDVALRPPSEIPGWKPSIEPIPRVARLAEPPEPAEPAAPMSVEPAAPARVEPAAAAPLRAEPAMPPAPPVPPQRAEEEVTAPPLTATMPSPPPPPMAAMPPPPPRPADPRNPLIQPIQPMPTFQPFQATPLPPPPPPMSEPVFHAQAEAEPLWPPAPPTAPPYEPVFQPPPAPEPQRAQPPRPSQSDENNLAEMAQRLEAALRRPTRPGEPPRSAAQTRVSAYFETPVQPGPPPPPEPRAPEKPAPRPVSLEEEMASLLGQPPGKT